MSTTIRFSLSFTVLFGLATLCLAPATAHAQEATRLPETTRHSVGLDTGLEGAFIARATYVYRLDRDGPPARRPDGRLFARATLPFVTPDLGDWGVDGGLRLTPLAWRDLRLAVLAGPLLRRSSNEAFSATAIGVGATVLLGYEGPRWGLSGELGYDQFLSTHISHSDAYREAYHADAKDGWYALSGSVARAGLRGGARIGDVEISARAGLNRTGELQAATPPFYVTLGTAYAF